MMQTRSNKWFGLILAVGVLIAAISIAGMAEIFARSLEPKVEVDVAQLSDSKLGWLPKPGRYTASNAEYDTTISINSLNMNDREITEDELRQKIRILALGDSHTFAVGASTFESWPKRLETRIGASASDGVVFNAAVSGYSVGQYLVRYRGLKDVLYPTLVIVGFSMATDLYDLIPPERGGFVYGRGVGRVYFDLDPQGQLIEKLSKSGAGGSDRSRESRDISLRVREFLAEFALYRRFKRSNLAMWVAVHRPGGVSLWPGLDTAVKKNLNEEDQYRWLLAERILGELVNEARASKTRLVVVNIPYLAQVYDETWAASFGLRPEEYDRWIAGRRLAQLCQRIGATYIDTTEAFVNATRERHRWLHWPQDAHPTPEGQDLISQVIVDGLRKSELIE
jgi:lysophospholipase L1-like esterase